MKTKNVNSNKTMFKRWVKNLFILTFIVLIAQSVKAQEEGSNPGKETQTSCPNLSSAGFLQTHFSADDITGSPASFSIQRARLGMTGNLSKNIKLNVIIGAAEPPDNTPALVNAFTDFTIDPLFNLRAGQFFAPFGLEGPAPITKNPAIERAFSTKSMNPFRMFRDIGVMAYGKHSIFNYSVAIMNGSGANLPENFNPKDFVGKVSITPVENLEAGISSHIGTYESGTEKLSRQRWGVHAEFHHDPVLLRGEFYYRDREVAPNNREQSSGGYLLGKYKFSDKWEITGRYDHYSPEFNLDAYVGFTLGPNYQISQNTQLALNGILYEPVNDNTMHYLVNLQLQMVL